ncbi:MAG: hypothetical protein LBV43_05075 [Prevotella sp.]|jgi:hypothetical protein|nr:hypothetical protein [Prevotella sp.]
MLHHRKKDYLMRLLEEMFKKLFQMLNQEEGINNGEKAEALNDAHKFFAENFEVSRSDAADILIEKINDIELLEQYPRLLFTEYQLTSQSRENLMKALSILEYLQDADKTYSWERTVLKEDILKILDEANPVNE